MQAVIAQLNCNTWEEASSLCRFTKLTNIPDYFQFTGSGWPSTPERGWGLAGRSNQESRPSGKFSDNERSKIKLRSQTAVWGQVQ